MSTKSFGTTSSSSRGSDLRGASRGRRQGWGRQLLAQVRGPWLPQALTALLALLLLGVLAAFLLGRY